MENKNIKSSIPGFVCSLVGIIVLPLILGIIGLGLSNDAIASGNNDGMAHAGKIIGIIDIIIGGVAVIWLLGYSCSLSYISCLSCACCFI